MESFTNVTPGTLPTGTVTMVGTIEMASLTAYRMTSGKWVPFEAVHGRAATEAHLVHFGWNRG